MVAAVALLDHDGHGFLYIYLVNGAEIPSLEEASSAYGNRLFRNNRDGTSTDVTEKAGVAGAGYGHACRGGRLRQRRARRHFSCQRYPICGPKLVAYS